MSEGWIDRDSTREAGRGLGARIHGDAGLLLRGVAFPRLQLVTL